MNEVEERLQGFLMERSAAILQIPQDAVSWEADVDEYGFNSMRANQLCFEISRHFNIYVQPVIFLEAPSLEAVSRVLMERFAGPIERKFL
jgi:Phosphopantetheine attachment site